MTNRYTIGRRQLDQAPVKPMPGVITKGLSPDVARRLQERYEELRNYFTNVLNVTRQLKSYAYTIGTTPTPLIQSPTEWPYIIYNCELPRPITKEELVMNTSLSYDGYSSELDVGNYKSAHVILNVTTITGRWNVILQTYSTRLGVWVDVYTLDTINTTGTRYYSLSDGVAFKIRLKFEQLTPGSTITLGASIILKDGLEGSGDGLSKVLWLGGRSVTPGNGLAVPENTDRVIFPVQGLELYGVAYTSVNVRVFSL